MNIVECHRSLSNANTYIHKEIKIQRGVWHKQLDTNLCIRDGIEVSLTINKTQIDKEMAK